MTEFNLSDKIFPHTSFTTSGAVMTEDVKEFIRLLKVKIGDCADQTDIWDNERWKPFRKALVKSINELAGEKLTK